VLSCTLGLHRPTLRAWVCVVHPTQLHIVLVNDELATEGEAVMLERVTAKLIEQYDIFTMPLLEKFVEERYPFIGPDQRRASLIGATTGARQAARLHYLVRCYESSASDTQTVGGERERCALLMVLRTAATPRPDSFPGSWCAS